MAGKLIMTKGLPGSGKTTFARDYIARHKATIVCKDDIRKELFQKTWNYDVEKEVLRVRDFRISEVLSKGGTAISADTNLASKHEARLRQLASKYKSSFEIEDFTSTPIAICIERDLRRDESVGEKVIRQMAEDFLKPAELIERTEFNGRQLFLDLDGVFADFDGFILKEFGIENNREKEQPDFWDRLRGYRGRLYYDMLPLDGAKTLYDSLARFNPIILTGCPWSIPTAAADKRQWVAENLDPKVQVICCKSRNKALYGKPGDVLLDDWNKWEERWTNMGGEFVLHDPAKPTSSVHVIEEVMHMKGVSND